MIRNLFLPFVKIFSLSTLTLLFALYPYTVASATSCTFSQNSLLVPITGELQNVVIDDNCQFAYVSNKTLNRVEVINLITGALSTPISVGVAPVGLDFSPDGTKLYVANSGDSSISIIDLAQQTATDKITFTPTSNGEIDKPFYLSVAQNGLVLFKTITGGSGYGGSMMQLDPNNNNTISKRTDLGQTLNGTLLKASADRSIIAIGSGDFTFAFYRYASSNNTFNYIKQMNASSIAINSNGSIMWLNGKYVVNPSGDIIATTPGFARAIDTRLNAAGNLGYRTTVAVTKIEVIDLINLSMPTVLNIPDTLNTTYVSFNPSVGHGQMGLSRDDSLLTVITDNGVSIINLKPFTSQLTPLPISPTPTVSPAPAISANTETVNLTSPLLDSGSNDGRRVATDGDGLFLHIYHDAPFGAVFGQYMKLGSPVTWPFVIAEGLNPIFKDNFTSVAMNRSGYAVATWWNRQTAQAQLIPPYAIGLVLNPITVGTGDGNDFFLEVGIDSSGNFAIAWTSGNNAYIKVFDSTGTITTDKTLITNNCTLTQGGTDVGCALSLAMNDNQIVVAWGDDNQINVRRYTHDLSEINTMAVDYKAADSSSVKNLVFIPQVAIDNMSNIAVAWSRLMINLSKGTFSSGVFMQRYNALNIASAKTKTGKPAAYKVEYGNALIGVGDISLNNQNSLLIAWENSAIKKMNICDSVQCYKSEFFVSSTKTQKFTVSDTKITKNKLITIEKGTLLNDKNSSSLKWIPNSEKPSAALDESGAFAVQWGSNQKGQPYTPYLSNEVDQFITKVKYYSK